MQEVVASIAQAGWCSLAMCPNVMGEILCAHNRQVVRVVSLHDCGRISLARAVMNVIPTTDEATRQAGPTLPCCGSHAVPGSSSPVGVGVRSWGGRDTPLPVPLRAGCVTTTPLLFGSTGYIARHAS